jgi:hypothetical protein
MIGPGIIGELVGIGVTLRVGSPALPDGFLQAADSSQRALIRTIATRISHKSERVMNHKTIVVDHRAD